MLIRILNENIAIKLQFQCLTQLQTDNSMLYFKLTVNATFRIIVDLSRKMLYGTFLLIDNPNARNSTDDSVPFKILLEKFHG